MKQASRVGNGFSFADTEVLEEFATGLLDFGLSGLYLRSDNPAPALRVGLVANGTAATQVARRVIQELRNSNFIELACRMQKLDTIRSQPHASLHHAKGSNFITSLYLQLIDGRYRGPSDPLQIVDCADLLAGCEVIEYNESEFPAERIRQLNLDVILWFAMDAIDAKLLDCSRYGVWAFHYGDSRRNRSSAPYMREMIAEEPTSAAELCVFSAASPQVPQVLCRSQFATTRFPSVAINQRAPCWGSLHFVIQKLWELHEHGWDHLLSRLAPLEENGATSRADPGNSRVATWAARQLVKKALLRLQRKQVQEHWRIAIRQSSTPLCEEPSQEQALAQFRWIESPAGHFWADPFLFAHQSEHWLFIEDFDYSVARACLSAGRLDAQGRLDEVRPVLSRPYHLSYPHIFAHAGEIFMIPESSESGRVELYRARNFPHDWVLERPLLNMRCVDTTVVRHDERWWLFTSPMPVAGHAPITLLFSAQDLLGPWQHHPDSPISRDVRVARGAGEIIRAGSRLLRPSQDCSITYGRSLIFNEITCMDEHRYSERPVRKVLPGWERGMIGVHTYNRLGTFEVLDGKFRAADVFTASGLPMHTTIERHITTSRKRAVTQEAVKCQPTGR